MTKKGFTLIELLVVITILAILAGAALPYVQGYIEESRVLKARTDLQEIAQALIIYEVREGEYTHADVSQLTGRYLNQAPIDPWGVLYHVATDSKLVISSGPSRDVENRADNIQVSYQPPLALVSVRWIDRNFSGLVDTQNTPDAIQLNFNRTLADDVLELGLTLDDAFQFNDGATDFSDIASWSSMEVVNASRTLVFELAADGVFQVGSDTVMVKSTHEHIRDLSDPPNKCIASQAVRIIAF